MITRSNLAEQLREYQIRSKHQWATLAFLSSTTNSPSRVDTTSLLLERCVFSSLVFAAVALYFCCILTVYYHREYQGILEALVLGHYVSLCTYRNTAVISGWTDSEEG